MHRVASVKPVLKSMQIRKQLNFVSSHSNALFMSVHKPFKVDIGKPISPACNQLDAVAGTGKPYQLSQITRPLGKEGRPQMTKDVANAFLVPNILESLKEMTIGVMVKTDSTCRTASS